MHSVGDLIGNRPLLCAKASWTVRETARFMSEKQVGALPVLEGDKLVGIFSERDLMGRIVACSRDPDKTSTREVMTTPLITADAADSFQLCLRKMQQARFRHLPVLRGGKLIGTVSLRELMQEDLEEKTTELRAMTEYIQGT